MTYKNSYVLPFYLGAILLVFIVRDISFFWDNILVGSQYANWYYETNFSKLFVPESMAGYPPLFGIYLAGIWKIFGRNLASSHWAMLPFLFGIIYQSRLLASKFLKGYWVYIAMGLMLFDPTVLAQCTQIGPDVPMLFLYLICANGITSGNKIYMAIALLGMSLLSPRAEIAIFAIGLSDLLLNRKFIFNNFRNFIHTSLPYIPSLFILIIWHYCHYQHYGWIFYNTATNDYAARVGFWGVFRNALLIIWRIADYGRIVMLIITGYVLWLAWHKNIITEELRRIFILAGSPLLVYSLIFLIFENPVAHRYYTIFYVLMGLLFTICCVEFFREKIRLYAFVLTFTAFIAGHFLVYPDHIAKGWDATLAYLPYDKCRKEMISFISSNHIAPHTVMSDFPAYEKFDHTDLNGDTASFLMINPSKAKYVMHSNVMNNDSLAATITNMNLIHEIRHGQVYCRLYKNNH